MFTMKTDLIYIPSQTLAGDTEHLRQHTFTRWMSRDLLQAATDFCRNLGLFAICCECSPDHLTRCVFWRSPKDAGIEIRSGRSETQFKTFDQANIKVKSSRRIACRATLTPPTSPSNSGRSCR